MTASPAPAAAPLPPISEEQLMALVPERVGAWRRRSLDRPAPTEERDVEPFVEAVFRQGKREARLRLASLAPDPGGDGALRETLREADGQVELRQLRPDGVVVIVRARGVPGAELKALALAVRRSAPPR